MHLKHGSVLQGGKYRIVKVLGAGSFGVTYLAKTKVTGNFGAIETSVAIKEFFSSELNTRLADGSVREMSGNSLASKYLKKFAEEADKISLLKEHPGIVKVLETFSENNTCYYVMEYKDGGSLREYVDGNGGVPESEAIEMIRKIGDALSYMHSRKMLHLDLKPGNVMMDSDGSLCLIDFGLSRHFENEESESTTGIGLGTVGYAPIEQAGYNSSDVRKDIPVTIDIYALGATFYKILTGKTPPPSYELLQSFPSAALEAKGVSAKTIETIKKAMSPIPSFRPQTVAEFLLMLDKDYKPSVPSVAEEEKTEIFLDQEPSQEPETINENSCEGDQTQVQHNEEKPQKKPRRWLWWLLAVVLLVGVGVFAVMSSMSGDETAVASTAERAVPQHEIDKAAYDSLMTEVSSITLDDLESCNMAIKLYGEALVYEEKYVATEYRSMFSEGASEKILIAGIAAEKFEAEAEAQKAKAELERMLYEADLKVYNGKMDDADKIAGQQKYDDAMKLYQQSASEASYINGVLRVKGVEYPMVYVSGGDFEMGSSSGDSDEKPVHTVSLDGYSIGKYEVTQELWEAVMGSNLSEFKGLRRPVENVSWNDCDEFIRKLNSMTGQQFRLPTEAEWEYAARGGKNRNTFTYSGSNTVGTVAWYFDNSGSQTHEVGGKSPNSLGIYDMSGNVYEWCYDAYSSDYYSKSPTNNPKNEGSAGSRRVVRGGSWYNIANFCRVSFRDNFPPDGRISLNGFRLCL